MRGRMITATAMVLVGLIWISQGLGLLRGTGFMVGDLRWAVAGFIAVLVGAALAVSVWRTGAPRA